MMKIKTKDLVGSALCLALGVILPMLFHAIGAGQVFLPMHIPVILAGFCFGPISGGVCGLLTPILSSVTTGMPPLYPTCISMTAELTTYGIVSGILYRKYNLNIYISLILTMLAGRIIGGIVSAIILGMSGDHYVFATFLSAYFLTSWPGIVLQLVILPPIVLALKHGHVIQNT